MQGDTDFTESGAVCRAIVNHNVTKLSGANYSNSSVSVIELVANNPQIVTTELSDTLGASSYLGYGFTSSVSSWSANSVLVPFDSTGNNFYTATYQCQNSSGDLVYNLQSLDPTLPNYYNPSDVLVASPSGSLSLIDECSEWDLLCKFKAWVVVFVTPSFSGFSEKLTEVREFLESKAPFGYALAFFDTSVPNDPELDESPPPNGNTHKNRG